MQVQTLKLDDVEYLTPAESHHLAEALCSMPKLTDLTLDMNLSDMFYSTLKASSSPLQGCFPQIKKGNFRFNGLTYDLDSFRHALKRLAKALQEASPPCTQSRVPQDDPEIPEKQAK
ncbi:uncharacterized protein LOC105444135 [Strongylocentrotus purpuratus]|uniref:Uncharacterized protein n=1 Tax=Strongylocentrotus purpuratus TaxID=7668 RepID=A0A7M7PBT5_STRPU|nr:uncharacterized protein LOC105444135 [Strongylocentrotus purpuratus]